MQFEEGTYVGRQSGTTDPVFWIWRPAGQPTEYWVLLEPGTGGGFVFPGPGNPSVKWTIEYRPSGGYATGCEFLAWVAEEFRHAESALVIHEHAVTTLGCES